MTCLCCSWVLVAFAKYRTDLGELLSSSRIVEVSEKTCLVELGYMVPDTIAAASGATL